LGSVIRKLKERFGEDPSGWSWGKARPLRLRHPFGEKKPLDQAFDIGPITVGGDSDTIAQVSSEPLDPLRHPAFIAGLRMVVDVGNWEASRFVLPSGQSGNPLSPHYADQLPLWERGDGVPIAWGEDEVEKACVARLKLVPKAKPG
ncbi:MAG: penicillin acylase family protein, partial [Actinomycetota bacterium]|nr:penicillin acylase family protein [Actinomycetota bacterium]